MKKTLLSIIFTGGILASAFSQQQRYVDEVFTNFTVENNIEYCTNYSVIAAGMGMPLLPTGTIIPGVGTPAPDLVFDLYEPNGDTVSERPLIIMLHTGTFAPIIRNLNPTGSRQDFATTEICKSFAKRGYVVANLEYRLGWNPAAPTQAERAASIMKAVFRAMQDTKSAVRFFRKDYAQTNQWGIDTSRIILCGQGSGGWVALGYATVDKLAEIQLPKFLDANAVPLIDTAVIGDWDGYGGNSIPGQGNMESNLVYSNDIHMVCNMGGAIGDLSWLEAGDVPMCAVHCPTDPIATYTTGTVSISGIGIVTTDISGHYDIMEKSNSLGNNSIFDPVNAGNDTYTLAAAAASASAVGIDIAFANAGDTLVGTPVPNVFPYITGNPYESAPWDYWDSATVVSIAPLVGATLAQAQAAHASGLQLNPNMSIAKAMAYIDTTLGYFCRRIVRATNLDGLAGLNDLSNLESGVQMYPNPTSNNITINSENGTINSIKLYTTAGKLVKEEANLSSNHVNLNNLNLTEGLYLCSIEINGQSVTKRLIIR